MKWQPWAFLALLVVFTFAKLPTLNTPFFHDEITFVDQVPNLVLGDLNLVRTEPYAGHPPLIGLLVSISSLFFPLSRAVPHMISLASALTALAFIYLIIKKIARKPFPLLITLLLAVTPMFFTQAGIMNLDMPATALILGAFYFYLKPEKIFFVFFSTLAVLAKEPAALILLIIVVFDFTTTCLRKPIQYLRENYYYSIPFILLIAWWLFCKFNFGWFIWPQHAAFFLKNSQGWAEVFFFICIESFGFIVLPFLVNRNFKKEDKNLISLIIAIILIPSIFFATILMKRYLLMVVPFIYILIALTLSRHKYTAIFVIAAIALLLIQIVPNARVVENYGGTNMNYLKVVALHKQGFDYLNGKFPNSTLLTYWPYYYQCCVPFYGYSTQTRNVVIYEYAYNLSDEQLPEIALVSFTILTPRIDSAVEFIRKHYQKVYSLEGYGNVFEIYKKSSG